MRTPFILLGLSVFLVSCTQNPRLVENPDPNHTHADFAVWVSGKQIDFSADKFMSGLSTDDSTHDEEHEYLHEHLHLHDNVGHVIHRHKPGTSLFDFFWSLGVTLRPNCLTLDEGHSFCNDDTSTWRMFVNGKETDFNPAYHFEDLDQILLTYGDSEEAIQEQLGKLTDDACLYSKRCPWRGDPPVENCIADPSIPCVE